MAKKDNKETKAYQKQISLTLFAKLDAALKDFQPVIGESKYVTHLQKTAKALAEDLVASSKKMKEKLEKEVKKNTKKKKTQKDVQKKVPKKGALKKIKEEQTPEETTPAIDTEEDDD